MVVFNLSHNNYQTLLLDIARQLKVHVEKDSVVITPETGEGIIKAISLPNGLQILMVKIHFYKSVMIKSGNTNPGDYVLNFDETEIPGEKEMGGRTINSFVRLTGSSFKHLETLKKNSAVQYIKILFSKEWLSNYIGLREKMSMFEKFIPVKSDAAGKEN